MAYDTLAIRLPEHDDAGWQGAVEKHGKNHCRQNLYRTGFLSSESCTYRYSPRNNDIACNGLQALILLLGYHYSRVFEVFSLVSSSVS